MSVAETESVPPASAAAALRLLPTPPCEPPYDDELPGARLRLVAGAPAPLGVPGRWVTPAPPLRLVPPPVPTPAPSTARPSGPSTGPAAADPDDLDGRTPLRELPPVRPFAQALVQRLLEVLVGLRPVGQLQRDTTLELYDDLVGSLAGRPRPAGPRPSRRDLRSLHVQEREDGVAEVCATVRRGGRVTALAFRLEGRSGSWRCTELVGV